MSDLSVSLEALARSRTQLPVTSYFDHDLYRREQQLIHQPGPRYVGHELAIPAPGDCFAVDAARLLSALEASLGSP